MRLAKDRREERDEGKALGDALTWQVEHSKGKGDSGRVAAVHGWLSYPHRDALMDEAVVKAVHPGGRDVDVDLACDWVSDQISLGREDIVEEEGAEDHADLDSEEAANDSHVVAILANAEPEEGGGHGIDSDVREHEVRNERD